MWLLRMSGQFANYPRDAERPSRAPAFRDGNALVHVNYSGHRVAALDRGETLVPNLEKGLDDAFYDKAVWGADGLLRNQRPRCPPGPFAEALPSGSGLTVGGNSAEGTVRINDAGQILCNATTAAGFIHAVLLTLN
jgi:hypothetical protein